MITELFIEGYKADVSADIVSLITFAIDDVKDFASRQTTFSKTVVLPGTANNNRLFGDIFEAGVANEYSSGAPNIGYNFNASKSARCLLFQDNMQTFKGTMRMLEIDIQGGRIEYEVALNGELTNLSVALSTNLLEDLDFSEYDRNYTPDDIIASWDNAPGSGLYYPLVDYGGYSAGKHDWDMRTFKPALYVKEFIDKMFKAAGYRYNSAFFNTDLFKRLIIPYNKKIFQGMTTIAFTATTTSSTNFIDQTTLTSDRPIPFTSISGTLLAPSLGNTRFTYVGADPLLLNFSFNADMGMVRTITDFHMNVYKNGVLIPGSTQTAFHNGSTSAGFFSYSYLFSYTVVTGDFFEFKAGSTSILGGNPDYMKITAAAIGATSPTSVLAPVGIGDFFQVQQGIPSNIRQVDFLKSIVQLFNLYITESQYDENLMNIEPFIKFYNTGFGGDFGGDFAGSGGTINWTYKMDRNSVIKINPMSELNSKLYNFNYADDTDYYNDLYDKRYNQTYGSLIYDSQFEFADQTSDLELIFAGTPLVGYDGEEKVYPTIFKRTGDVVGVGEEQVDSVIRILQTKKILGVSPWAIKDGTTTLRTTTSYGYAGHFDDPDAPTNDINFGVLNELFFTLVGGDLTQTAFNVYWSAYMAEITDKDSKLLTASFYLKPIDILNLNFANYIYVDGNLWRLNKIEDYNASQPSLCTVELLKVINQQYNFVPPFPSIDTFYWIDSDGTFVTDSDSSKILYQ